jgi:hypothetical protein
MLGVHVKKLGTWLAILAIALQAAWPLLAAAKPRAVALVPLCTVDGVTHYLEVPTGKTPLEESTSGHHDHCAFCFLGIGGMVSSHAEVTLPLVAAAERIAPAVEDVYSRTTLNLHGARAPPFPLWLRLDQPHRGNHETASAFERHCIGAVIADPGVRVLRLGVLHS